MALRTPTRLEIGQRVRWLRRQADFSGRALAVAIGATDTGIMTKIERKGESLDIERVVDIANACAGRGPIVEDEKLVYDFLMGFVDDPRVVLRPTLGLVQPVSEALVTSDSNVQILYLGHWQDEQGFRDLSAVGQ